MAGGIENGRAEGEFGNRGQPGAGGLFLRRADFEDEVAAARQVLPRLFDEAVEDDEPTRAAVERGLRLVLPYADRQLRQVFGRDVRRVADDHIERLAGDGGEQVAMQEADAVG